MHNLISTVSCLCFSDSASTAKEEKSEGPPNLCELARAVDEWQSIQPDKVKEFEDECLEVDLKSLELKQKLNNILDSIQRPGKVKTS